MLEGLGGGGRGALHEMSTSPSFQYPCRPIVPLCVGIKSFHPDRTITFNYRAQKPAAEQIKKKKRKEIQTNLQHSMTDRKNNAKWGKENEKDLLHAAFQLKMIPGCWKKQRLQTTNKNDCFSFFFSPTPNSLEVKTTWLANLDTWGYKRFQLLSLLITY